MKPKKKQSVAEWAKENVYLSQGRDKTANLDLTPWLKEPLEAIADSKIKKIVVIGSIGSGKTTLVEVAIPWRVANAPSNILFICQTDPDAAIWAESRLTPSIKKNPELCALLSAEKDKTRKTTIFFNNGIYLDIGGPSMSNLQNKSTPLVIIDEAWLIAAKFPGRIQEAKGRMHDKWNRKFIVISQGGEVGDDCETEYLSGSQHEFHFRCPHCNFEQKWKHKQVRWDTVKDEFGKLDVVATRKSVKYVCANSECQHEFPDEIETRRSLSTLSYYVRTNYLNQEEFLSFRYNVFAVWWRPWWEHAVEWIEATDYQATGSLEKLKIVVQKRLAEFWNPEKYEVEDIAEGGAYSIQEYANGELIDEEHQRFMFVDVQQSHFWYVIRACTQEGESRLIACGMLHTYQEIEDIRNRYKIMNAKLVHLDCAWNTGNVLNKCAEYGWTAFRGVNRDFFNVKTKNGERKSIVASPQKGVSASGKPVTILNFSTVGCLDLLADLRAGRSAKWEFPYDVPEEWKKHMKGKKKRKHISPQTKKVSYIWVDAGKDDHMMDCEMGCVGAMVLARLIKEPEIGKKVEESIPENHLTD